MTGRRRWADAVAYRGGLRGAVGRRGGPLSVAWAPGHLESRPDSSDFFLIFGFEKSAGPSAAVDLGQTLSNNVDRRTHTCEILPMLRRDECGWPDSSPAM